MKTPLRVAILTPTALPGVTGNAVTAERWRRHLSQKGAAVLVIKTASADPRQLVAELDDFHPHLIHAHHVTRAGALILHPDVAKKYSGLPFVVSPAGISRYPSMTREPVRL